MRGRKKIAKQKNIKETIFHSTRNCATAEAWTHVLDERCYKTFMQRSNFHPTIHPTFHFRIGSNIGLVCVDLKKKPFLKARGASSAGINMGKGFFYQTRKERVSRKHRCTELLNLYFSPPNSVCRSHWIAASYLGR